MGNYGGAAAANILGHTHPGPVYLGIAALAPKLLDNLSHLIHPGCTDRMPAGLQAAPSTYRDAAAR